MSNLTQLFTDVQIYTFLIEVGIFTAIYYYLLRFFQGSRGAQALTGFLLFYGALWLISFTFEFEVINRVVEYLSIYLVVALVIIFAPEIRRALSAFGRNTLFNANTSDSRHTVEAVIETVTGLAERKIGAIIAIEREIGLRVIRETGTPLDSPVNPQLLASIFYPRTPLHDGGVIIAGNRIVAASCVFPLSDQPGLNKSLGTRHRAALGLTDETDAVIIVVSEETGTISLACNGKLSRGLDEEHLRRLLQSLVLRGRHSSPSKVDKSAAPDDEEEAS